MKNLRVRDLIAELQQRSPDSKVMIFGDEEFEIYSVPPWDLKHHQEGINIVSKHLALALAKLRDVEGMVD